MTTARRALPNTKTLLVFEAAARRGSFSLAAADLGLTQSAVSHQIKSFESRLGVTLFVRTPTRMELTAKGLELLIGLSPLLDALETALEKVTTHPSSRAVKIVTYSTFGLRWLLPELLKISQCAGLPMPDIQYVESNVTYDAEASDFAILQGEQPWRGLEAKFLMHERLIVAAAPGFAEPEVPISELIKLPYFNLYSRPISFGSWARTRGFDVSEPAPVRHFQTFEQMIVACMSGLGFGVFPDVLIRHELQTGLLIPLSGGPVDVGFAYFILHSKKRAMSNEARVYVEALLQNAN